MADGVLWRDGVGVELGDRSGAGVAGANDVWGSAGQAQRVYPSFHLVHSSSSLHLRPELIAASADASMTATARNHA